MYKFYIAGVLLPIPPSSLKISIEDKDEEIDLANSKTMSVLNQPGLTTYSFEFRIPNTKYPFAMYDNGYMEAPAFLSLLSRLKMSQSPFTFKVIRGNVYVDHRDINTQVSLVSYDIEENAENGMDFMISIELKEYVKFMTYKEAQAVSDKSTGKDIIVLDSYVQRDDNGGLYLATSESYYTVKEGDTFQSVSQMMFGTMDYAEAIAVHNNVTYSTDELPEGLILNMDEELIKSIAEELDKKVAEEQAKQSQNLVNKVLNDLGTFWNTTWDNIWSKWF